jgi:glycosyltransferase involved in cell wall biosynthesis
VSLPSENAAAEVASCDPPLPRVVIAAHNAEVFIGETLGSLVEQVGAPEFEVVVVLSACTDHTASVVAEFSGRLDLKIIESPAAGANVARNLGADAPGGSGPVLFLDHDDVAEEGWVAAMVASLTTADIVLGRYALDRLNSAETLALRGPVVFSTVPKEYSPTTLTGQGGNCGFRAKVWRSLGGLDPGQAFVDDVEILWRAYDKGNRIAYAADAVVQYRLRDTASAYFQQYMNRYCGWAHLHRSCPARVPRRSVPSALKQYAWVLLHLRRAWSNDPGRRGVWIYSAARIVGSLRGSFRYKTFFP